VSQLLIRVPVLGVRTTTAGRCLRVQEVHLRLRCQRHQNPWFV